MTAISNISTTWQAAEDQFKQQREAWQTARAPLADRVAAFDAEQNPTLLRKLTRAFEKVTRIASVKRKIGKLDAQMQSDEFDLRAEAEKQYQTLGEIALGMPATSAADVQRYMTVKDIRAHVQDAAAKIATATQEAEQASSYELMDMAANNKGISLLSYLETDEAKHAIAAAGESISALNAKLGAAQKQDAQIVKDLGFSNTVDLFLDMAGGFAGAFTSYLNMQKLDDAVTRMQKISKTLSEMDAETGYALRMMQTAAIRSAQGGVEGMDKLAKSIAPYMPADTAEVLGGNKTIPRMDVIR